MAIQLAETESKFLVRVKLTALTKVEIFSMVRIVCFVGHPSVESFEKLVMNSLFRVEVENFEFFAA